jgi:zinc protease
LFELSLRFNAGACQDGDTRALRRLRCIRSIKASKPWTPKASRRAQRPRGKRAARHQPRPCANRPERTLRSAPLREAALELFTAMVARPALEADAYSGIQARVLRYLQRRESSPAQRIDVEMLSRLFPQHAYGRDCSGTSVSVAGIDVDKVRAFHQRAYTAANLEITLVRT